MAVRLAIRGPLYDEILSVYANYRPTGIWYGPFGNDMAPPMGYPDRAIRRPPPDPLLEAVGGGECADPGDPGYDESRWT